eukprot:10386052-Prorocentrum_lima.AAC.1
MQQRRTMSSVGWHPGTATETRGTTRTPSPRPRSMHAKPLTAPCTPQSPRVPRVYGAPPPTHARSKTQHHSLP